MTRFRPLTKADHVETQYCLKQLLKTAIHNPPEVISPEVENDARLDEYKQLCTRVWNLLRKIEEKL